ncbi:hypothetical protein GCM10009584_22490 [Ornithinimicrobium humiphilum]|uniref:non-specific serine/threonine protein kinase n=1 Tax=Ornithinimicrobium humiphilum TaxID=125288 RepID=A0A543KMZ6_9MICO|nr:serine/threonine-protein kinase [Ornithinimicrobium humiphilum]TQM96457.1 serine/threonine protein kinase [Ornithinimicrobium humiphilum]
MEQEPEELPRVPGYEVLGRLGEGASATVWRARRLGDGLDVALKVLTPAGGDVTEGLREAGLLAGVRHRHVVRLHDVLPLPDPVSGRPASVVLATQLAAGGSLAQVLARRRILTAGELVTALQPVAGALADLHGQGIVHADLSPGNVLFLRDGMPLLGDLGAARVTGVTPGDPQGTGATSGMVAPEVVEGFPATQESDVYQLGAVAWLCLAGEPPGPPWSRRDLEELAPGLPAGLADLVTRCLAPEPGDRPDAEEVALALLAAATPEPVEVAPDADPGFGVTERLRRAARDDLGAADETRARRRAATRSGWQQRPRLLVALAAALVLLVTGALVVPAVAPRAVDVVRGVADRPDEAAAGGGVEAEPRPAPAPEPPAPEPPAPEPQPPPAPEPPETAGPEDADDQHLAAVLQGLVDGRAAAWRKGDLARLADVLASGSPALTTDTASLERAVDLELRYPELAFSVAEVEVVARTDRRLEVEAVLGRDGVRGVGDEGQVLVEEPGDVGPVRLVLTRQDPGSPWRLWSWEPA